MKRSLVTTVLLCACSFAQAQSQPSPKPVPPPYTPSRWQEDYSYLKKPENRTDWADPVKYIPLGREDIYLSVGGQIRERYERFDNNNFGAGPQDDSGYFLTRILLNTDLHIGKYVRFFAMGKSALIDDRTGGPRPTDADEIDVEQAFGEVKVPYADKRSVSLRVGRQDLIYGAQRLISPLDWTNIRRTFEGAKVSWATPNNTLDAFWVRPVLIDKEKDNAGDGDTSFAGIYDTISLPNFLPKANTKLELYGLALNKTQNATTPLDSDTYTVGTRFSSTPKPFDFDIELDYQFGKNGSGDISAWSIATEAGYTIEKAPLMPRFFVGFDAASGDDNLANPDKGTFNQLFPLGHAYFGYIDVIGRQNIVDIHPGVVLTVIPKKVTFRADYHWFWRESGADALYGVAGAVQRAGGKPAGKYVGSELDLLATWQIDRHFSVYVGYSHFFAGTFIQRTGASNDIDFLYAAGTFTF